MASYTTILMITTTYFSSYTWNAGDCFSSLTDLLPKTTGRSEDAMGVSANEQLADKWHKKLKCMENKKLNS